MLFLHRLLLAVLALFFLIFLLLDFPVVLRERGSSTTERGSSTFPTNSSIYEKMFVAAMGHSSSLDFMNSFSSVAYNPGDSDDIPLLATFIHGGGSLNAAYLREQIRALDYPVEKFVIIQDSKDDSAEKLVRDVILQSGSTFVRKFLHIINVERTGCSQAWNTVFRLFPEKPLWLFSSLDVRFKPGALKSLFKGCAYASKSTAAVSTSMQFGQKLRQTFGLMAWCVTRTGLKNVGMFDENFFPSYGEDDDWVFRAYMANMTLRVVPEVAIHGKEGDTGYIPGTGREDATLRVRYQKERQRGDFKHLLMLKWNKTRGEIVYSLMARKVNFQKYCREDSLFCHPYNDPKLDFRMWNFSPVRRKCIIGELHDQDCREYSASFITNSLQRKMEREFGERAHLTLERDFKDPQMSADFGFGIRNIGQFWDYFEPTTQCPSKCRLGRLGDGGKWVCLLSRLRTKSVCTVYSFGSNGEISFEESFYDVMQGNCRVHIFDPTLMAGVKANKNQFFNGRHASNLTQKLGGQVEKLTAGSSVTDIDNRLHYHLFGLGVKDTSQHKIGNLRSLTAIMKFLKHEHIDVLKIDVEGFEWDVIKSWKQMDYLPVDQILIEMHWDKPFLMKEVFEILLKKFGFSIFQKEPVTYGPCFRGQKPAACKNIEYCFVKKTLIWDH
jgi:FkbM family methyltransferase